MKTIVSAILVLLFAFPGKAQFSKGTLQATGLTCAMCSNAVNKALQQVPFVESVRSDIKNSAFNITFKTGSEINIDAIKDAVEDAGFSVGSLKLTGTFDAIKIDDDGHTRIGTSNFHFLPENKQVLNGVNTITVVDKDFLTAKQFKKISATTKSPCVMSGKTASCTKEGMPANTRIYHVTI